MSHVVLKSTIGSGANERIDALHVLLECGVDQSRRDHTGRTALIVAVRRGDVGATALLLAAGSPLNAAQLLSDPSQTSRLIGGRTVYSIASSPLHLLLSRSHYSLSFIS
jgi:ankyrin repeat protein